MSVTIITASPQTSASSLTLPMHGPHWKPGPGPSAGDLVFLSVTRPYQPVPCPPGWTEAGQNIFWRVHDPDCLSVTLISPYGGPVEVEARVVVREAP